MREKLKDRFNIVIICFLLMGAIIVSQLVNLQVVNGKYYDDLSQRRLLSKRKIVAPRGNILDRYGIPIAVNRQGFTAQMVKVKMTNEALNEMLLKLVNIFEKNNDSFYHNLDKYITINPFAFGSAINQSDGQLDKWKNDIAVKPKDVELLSSPEEVFKYFRNQKFKINVNYSDDDAYKIMILRYELLIRGYSALNPLSLAKSISRETVAELEEKHQEFPGISTEMEPVRKYMDAQLEAHVVGYVGALSPAEYAVRKDEGYDMNDLIGIAGVERAAESYLKGKPGLKKVEVDIGGRLTEELNSDPPVPGNDVVLTLDTKLQKVAMESLERNIAEIRKNVDYKKNMGDANAGAAVAIDVNTGEVLVMASYPTYNPSVFLEGVENKEAQKIKAQWLLDKSGKPMLNRAIQENYAPGSTFKPITAIAGLEESVITKNTYIYDSGTVEIGGMIFKCLEFRDYGYTHGNVNLKKAIETSCNIYFHKLGDMVGIDKIGKWAKAFGLGEKTGIDISTQSEVKGVLASKAFKKELADSLNKMNPKNNAYPIWVPADTAQAAIGQSFNAFTPIQMASYMSSLANGGKKYKPHLIKKVIKNDGSTVMETKPEFEQIPIQAETIHAVQEGMVAVTNAEDGTAAYAFRDFPFAVAGKTGTAETGITTQSSNGLFVCYAPANDPKIAVAVVLEKGAWGAYAAPIARDILAEYFNLNKSGSKDDKLKADDSMFTR